MSFEFFYVPLTDGSISLGARRTSLFSMPAVSALKITSREKKKKKLNVHQQRLVTVGRAELASVKQTIHTQITQIR